jgi:hypothetical protein
MWPLLLGITIRSAITRHAAACRLTMLPDAGKRSGDPRGHQGLAGEGPHAIGPIGEVPRFEVGTCRVVYDL